MLYQFPGFAAIPSLKPMALRCTWGVSRQNRWRGWCWFWVCELGFWCANVYCHQGDGAVKMLCGPQSNVLVRERFSCVRGWSRTSILGIEPPGIPHSPRRRGPCNNVKKAQRAPSGTLCFFVLRPSFLQALLATVCPGTKKALKRCLRAFFCCCGERGIRTPGTVTRTTV